MTAALHSLRAGQASSFLHDRGCDFLALSDFCPPLRTALGKLFVTVRLVTGVRGRLLLTPGEHRENQIFDPANEFAASSGLSVHGREDARCRMLQLERKVTLRELFESGK